MQCEQFTFVKDHMAAGRKTLTGFNSTAGVGSFIHWADGSH